MRIPARQPSASPAFPRVLVPRGAPRAPDLGNQVPATDGGRSCSRRGVAQTLRRRAGGCGRRSTGVGTRRRHVSERPRACSTGGGLPFAGRRCADRERRFGLRAELLFGVPRRRGRRRRDIRLRFGGRRRRGSGLRRRFRNGGRRRGGSRSRSRSRSRGGSRRGISRRRLGGRGFGSRRGGGRLGGRRRGRRGRVDCAARRKERERVDVVVLADPDTKMDV